MTPRSQLALVLVLLALVIGVALLQWRHSERLEATLGDLSVQIDTLRDDVSSARERAQTAEQRADRAEERATAAVEEAAAAGEEARLSADEAREATWSRQEAERVAQEARTAREEARRLAAAEEETRRLAEQKAEVAEQERLDAVLEKLEAEEKAQRAEREAEELRAERERERGRLMESLSRIAETRRTALGVVMNLDERHVEFDFNKADLRAADRELLSRIGGVLLTFEDVAVEVVGHTDDVGSEAYNQELSERRAEAVRAYLVEVGLDPDIVTIRGLGESSPLVEGTDPDSRQRNRRVELAITLVESHPGEVAAGGDSGGR